MKSGSFFNCKVKLLDTPGYPEGHICDVIKTFWPLPGPSSGAEFIMIAGGFSVNRLLYFMEPEGLLPRHGLWVSVLRTWPEIKYVWPPCVGTLTVKYKLEI
jgi:hypothetical protein